MKTIKELEAEILKEQTKADGLGIYCQGSLTALKDVLGVIDEMDEFVSGLISAEELKKRISG